MAENFNLIFGSQAPETASWSDADYQTGWNTVGSTPPTAEQFDFLQNRADKKAQELYNRLTPLEQKAQELYNQLTPLEQEAQELYNRLTPLEQEAQELYNRLTPLEQKAQELHNRLTPLEQKAQEQGRQAGTAYTAGASATVDGLPADWLLVCTTAGISGTSAVVLPNPLVDGATITDGTITWTLRKLATNGALGYRQPLTTQRVGDIRYHATLPTGWHLECTTAGTTRSGELTITSPTVGGTVSDGTVTWTVRKNASTQDLTGYLPLSGGAMTGGDITRNIDSSALSIRGGSDVDRGGSIELYGKDYDMDSLIGAFRLISSDSNDMRYIEGHPDGTLTWGGNSLDKSAVVAEHIGVNGYRKYADGLLEQWGYVGTVGNKLSTVILPVSYSSRQFIITGSTTSADNFAIAHPSKSQIIITTSYNTDVYWHAIGY